ncbi:MAG: DUF2283 domain-containing protein [Nanoarchaeota archaeon]|nr:DUF2283 domain-containing protein [Nanoarchaeota archaeon]MBU1103388.1 DUF2283 domain-containing protein [Nanoarchaeota archaeon]
MAKKCKFNYDSFSDRLFISCKNENEKVYGSVRVLNLTIDFTTENKAVGVEIVQASKYLKSLNINPEILNKLTNAELVFEQKRKGYLIYFILHAGNHIERVPYNIIAEQPVVIR